MIGKVVSQESKYILPEDLEGFEIEGINKNRYDGIYNDDTYAIIVKEPIYKKEGENRVLIGYAHTTFPCCKIDDKTILKSITDIPLTGALMWVEEYDEDGVMRPRQPVIEMPSEEEKQIKKEVQDFVNAFQPNSVGQKV